MPKNRRKRAPKSVLRLPDLERSKSAVLNSLASPSSHRSYDHAIREFIEGYCSEPRLAFNKTVVTRYRRVLDQRDVVALCNFPDAEGNVVLPLGGDDGAGGGVELVLNSDGVMGWIDDDGGAVRDALRHFPAQHVTLRRMRGLR